LQSPEVHADGRVTFRIRAPHAQRVLVTVEGEPAMALRDDGDGEFSITIGPLAPDIYAYAFSTDGVRSLDASNVVVKPSLIAPANLVEVAGATPAPWDVSGEAHGVLHHHFFHSTVVGDDRDVWVYTPPGYEPAGRAYPVLYLLHGFSDDASAWTVVGRAHVILDTLLAQQRAVPMIVVMPLGYGAPELLAGGFTGYAKNRELLQRNFDRFRESLLTEVIPLVERSYRAEPQRANRAIAGLSMGGAESLLVGLNRLADFAWIGSFSQGGLPEDLGSVFPDLGRADERLRLLWITCGSADPLAASHRALDTWLTLHGIRHVSVERPGAHTWAVWRRALVDFVPLLFRAQSPQ
jgi:enterochelin esterase-like enzyme